MEQDRLKSLPRILQAGLCKPKALKLVQTGAPREAKALWTEKDAVEQLKIESSTNHKTEVDGKELKTKNALPTEEYQITKNEVTTLKDLDHDKTKEEVDTALPNDGIPQIGVDDGSGNIHVCQVNISSISCKSVRIVQSTQKSFCTFCK